MCIRSCMSMLQLRRLQTSQRLSDHVPRQPVLASCTAKSRRPIPAQQQYGQLSRAGGGMGEPTTEQQLIKLQQQLLDSIANRDWHTYAELCDESLTAFEPEAVGHLVEGLPFHKFYFDLLAARENYKPPTNTISQPHVRMLGDSAAVVNYIRLQQKIDANGRPLTAATEETRVWERKGGKWKNVHFHRSPTTPSS